MSIPWLAESETPVPIVRGPGEGKTVGILRGPTTIRVGPDDVGGAYAILEQTIPAGHGPPLHVHRQETEVFYILEGRFTVTLGSQTIDAPTGALVVAPRDIPHTFRNVGSDTGRLLLTIIPGRFANYFVEADGVPDGDIDTIKALCAHYEVEILE